MANAIKIDPAISKEVLVYRVRQDKEDLFRNFFIEGEKDAQGNTIEDPPGVPVAGVKAWLNAQNPKVKARVWTFKQADLLMVMIAVDQADTDWRKIPHFANYLQGGVFDDLKAEPTLSVG
jgi:hypothetical protein